MCSTVIPPHAHTQEMPSDADIQEISPPAHTHPTISPFSFLVSPVSSLKPQSTETYERVEERNMTVVAAPKVAWK